MKQSLFWIALIVIALQSCNTNIMHQTPLTVNADSLIKSVNQFENTLIQTEGTILHVCGVDRKKAKLKTPGGEIIRLDVSDSIPIFDKSLTNQKVRVQGYASEFRIYESYIDSLAKTKSLLCHVDHYPCKDVEWVNAKIEAGLAEGMLSRSIEKLKAEMNETGDNFISTVNIKPYRIDVIQ